MKTALKTSLLILVLTVVLAKSSYAWDHDDWDHDHWHHHSHVSFGLGLSFPAYTYYDYDPYYYPRYVVAPAPTTVVTSIPPNYQIVSINGMTYYVSNGAYYVYNGYGYELVSPPVTTAPVATYTAPVEATTTQASQDTFVVNIPNDKGGYTAVSIRRSGNGFVGPQGEFYSEFPKVQQLKLMYGKK